MYRILLLVCSFILPLLCVARDLPHHCGSDKDKIETILGSLKGSDLSLGQRASAAAEALIGGDEDDYYTSDSIACLRVNVDSFTPLMFVNTVVALAKASESPGLVDVNTFENEFESVACRRGENRGFPSIMYHSSDWIGDNMARGNITELTENYNGVVARTKSLDEMTRYRKNFAALADSATFESVRMTEMGFRTHRVPSLKKETIKKKELVEDLQDGDILILVPNRDGIDIYDMGFVKFENGAPHFIHLNPHTHKIVKEEEDLARYMALMTKYFQGYRILRLKD